MKGVIEDNTYRRPGPRVASLAILARKLACVGVGTKKPTTLQALKGVIEDNTNRRPGPRGASLAILACKLACVGVGRKKPTTLQALKGVIEDNAFRRPGPRGASLVILAWRSVYDFQSKNKVWNLLGDKGLSVRTAHNLRILKKP